MELIVRRYHGDVKSDTVYQYHEIETLASNPGDAKRPRELIFVTGNKNKILELEDHIKPKLAKLIPMKLDLIEIQDSDSLNIVEDKCRKAYQQVKNVNGGDQTKKCVMIDDCGLHFKAYNGLPGPYIKWFVDEIKPIGLYKMLEGFDDKTASATCTYALMEDESKVVFCRGTANGRIVMPRGDTGWGWDPAFEEDRTRNTFAEMDKETKAKFSHRANAITVLKKYLATVHSATPRD